MPCERIDCAQCLTVMALKNDAAGVSQFLSNVDKSKSFDPYLVIPSDAIRTWAIEGVIGLKDGGQISTYLLTDSTDAHLMFQQVTTQQPIRQNGYDYHISPFYMILNECRWITPQIISSIVNAHLVDPFELHEEVTIRMIVCELMAEYWPVTKRNVVSMFTSMHRSVHQNHLMETLNESNVNARLPYCGASNIYPEGHPNKEWWNYQNDCDRIWRAGGRSVFAFLLQNRWEVNYTRDLSTLLVFRHRIMMPLIERGFDVNLHILDFYSWSPSTCSTYPNVLGELIRNGLSNFNTSSKASLAAILIFEALPKAGKSVRRWGKVRLLLKLLHKLGASFQMTPEQSATEEHILRLTKERVSPEAHLHRCIADVKNLVTSLRYAALMKAHQELALFQQQRRNPLQLADFARISVRQAVGGQHFVEKIGHLPLPSRIKSFLNADFTAQLISRVFDFYFTRVKIFFLISSL